MLLDSVLMLLLWIISGVLIGFVGMHYGPGVVMLLVGLLLGVCGGFVHILARAIDFKLRWWNSGFCIAIIALTATAIMFEGHTRSFELAMFLFVFYMISSTIIFAFVDLIKPSV